MSVKDDFVGSSIIVKIVFFIALLAQFCNWIAFCTTSWFVNEDYNMSGDDRHFGLWRLCYRDALQCSYLDGYGDDAYAAVQAFAVFGFAALNVAFFLLVLYMFWGSCKGNSETGFVSGIVFIASCLLWLISVIVFGADVTDDWDKGDLGFSFALAVCALILALIAGILMIIGGRGGGSVGTK